MHGTPASSSPSPAHQPIPVEQALAYLRQGWSVVPVVLRLEKSGKVSKRPAIKWQMYQQRLPTEEEISLWFGEGKYNAIGVVTGKISRVVVVDIEHDATDDDVAGIESPLESHTISGGRHVFYRWTKPLKNSVRLNDKPIDFRGDGGFVVLPPSQIGNRGYSWLMQADPSSLSTLPPHVEQVLIGQTPTNTGKSDVFASQNASSMPDRLDFPIAHQGERNSTAASVAGSLCANMSPKLWDLVGWQAFMQWNNLQCKPPLAVSELRSVWQSITSSHQRTRKGQESRYTFESASQPSKPITILPWSQFRQQQFAEPEWVVESLIPDKGLVAVAGPPESCKSYFTTYVAIAVARGETLFEHYPTKRVGVLLVDQENLPAWIQHRLLQFSTEDQLPLHIYANRDAPFNLEDQDAFAQVVEYIKTHQIGLLIFDTLRLSHTRDENSSTDMKPVFDQLKKLTKHATVIFIQHHRKGDRKESHVVHGEDMMGSMLIRGSVDYQLSIVKLSDVSEGVTQIKVTQTKARYTRNLKPFTLTLDEQDDQLHFSYSGLTVEPISKRRRAQDAIIALLKDHVLTRQEIIDHITDQNICSTRTADSALRDLKRSQRITQENSAPNRYSLNAPSSRSGAQLQALQNGQLQPAKPDHPAREKTATQKTAATSQSQSQVQNTSLQIATPYIYMQFAEDDSKQCEKARKIISTLHSGDLNRRILATKKWLLRNEKHRNPNFEPKAWVRQLQVYQLLVDEAQNRGIDKTGDWLEMARMTFHTDDGVTGQWIN